MDRFEFVSRVQRLLSLVEKGDRVLRTEMTVPRPRGQSHDAAMWELRETMPETVYVTLSAASGRSAWIVILEGAFDDLVTCLYAMHLNHEKALRRGEF